MDRTGQRPRSDRFIHIGGVNYSLADFFIIGATPVFLLAVGCLGRRPANWPAPAGP